HLDRPILPQHCLEAIDCWCPREVLDPAKRLSQVPGNHHAIGQFLHVALAGHARFEEHTDGRHGVDERARGFLQLSESVNANSTAASTTKTTTTEATL